MGLLTARAQQAAVQVRHYLSMPSCMPVVPPVRLLALTFYTQLLHMRCSVAGFYMPANDGSTDISKPAASAACSPCPVRCHCMICLVAHSFPASGSLHQPRRTTAFGTL